MIALIIRRCYPGQYHPISFMWHGKQVPVRYNDEEKHYSFSVGIPYEFGSSNEIEEILGHCNVHTCFSDNTLGHYLVKAENL